MKITKGSGNVFRDLGLPDAENMLRKADAAQRLGLALKRAGLSNADAAGVLGIEPERLAAILRGHLRAERTEDLRRFERRLRETRTPARSA